MIDKICKQCGGTYKVNEARANKTTYCSRTCMAVGYTGQVRTPPVEKVCLWCKQGYTVPARWRKRSKFCSKRCKMNQWHSDNPPNTAHEPCPECGKPCKRQPHMISKKRFCSRACLYRWSVGPNGPNWRGGPKPYYRGPNWKEQRQAARKRDGYLCQHCGKAPEQGKRQPDVHHLQPFSEFASYHEANQLDNLVTLCRSCHGKMERDYQRAKKMATCEV